jgi:hypothetical protein
MSNLITNKDVFEEGAFILNENSSLEPSGIKFPNVFLTHKENNSIKTEILKLIHESKSVIKLCSFILTDKDIFEALLERAKSFQVAIFVLTQLDNSKLINTSLLTEEETLEQTNKTHLSHIKKLYDNGVHVRASDSAHAKFILSDRKIGFIMSANITTPSLTINTESGIYVDSNDVQNLDNLFDVIFQKGTLYRQYLSSAKKSKGFIVQNDISIKKEWLPNHSDVRIRYSYENYTNNLYEEIIDLIRNAKSYLYISTYSIVKLENLKEFITEIKNARNRGVTIYVFCRGMNYRFDHLNGCNSLSKLGCLIFADFYNHSKGIINEKNGLIFTANIDGAHGLKNGFEVGYILNEVQRQEFLEFHKYLIKTSPYIFIDKPARELLFATYSLYEQLKNIKSPVFSENIEIRIKKQIVNNNLLETLPIFFGKTKDKYPQNYIIVGNYFFKCQCNNDIITVNEKANAIFNIEKYILKYKNLKITYI